MGTIRDVARLAGVSPKTVSRVLNNENTVRSQTRDRVVRAIQELSYRPNLFARGLSGARPYAVRLVYDNPNAYYVVALQAGALKACDELGYDLQIHPCDPAEPRRMEKLHALARQSHFAGIVVAPPLAEHVGQLSKLAALHIPLVRIISARSEPSNGVNCVYVNDRDAAYNITEHLIQLGHVRIGFLCGRKQFSSSIQRYNGYKAALADYGLALIRELVIQGDYSFDDGFRGARRLLSLAEPPTAVFASNDEIAAGVLAAARAGGLRVPSDLSIAGFEDNPYSRFSWPPLTTARQDMAQIAEHATRMLIAKIGGQTVQNEGFTPELVVRGSSAPPATRQ